MMKHTITLICLFLLSIQAFAQHTYLVNRHEPEDSHRCDIYRYNGSSSKKIEMAGGKKIFDEKIRGYDIPKHYVLDVSGVDELKFTIVASYLDIAVANAILWKKGQTPVDIRKTLPKAKKAELTKDIKAYYVSNFMEEITPESEDPLIINKQKYEYGLRGSMNMALIGVNKGYAYYNLQKQYSKLSFIAGCRDDVSGRTGSGWLTIKADNKIIEEIEIKKGEIARQFILDISGCESLSFHTEQISGDSYAEIAEIMVYPEGETVAINEPSGGLAPPEPRLKDLPDVCKLISNIKPYTAISSVKKQIYDGAYDYITFSMGGTKVSEGFILYDKVSFFNDDPSSSVTFDMGNEFDYISFTAGYVGKSWNMNDDYLLVYADDELVFSTKLVPTYPNVECVVPIKEFGTLMKECFDVVENFYNEKLQEAILIQSFVDNALVIDGVSSTEDYMIFPVTAEDIIPEYQLQQIKYFDIIE